MITFGAWEEHMTRIKTNKNICYQTDEPVNGRHNRRMNRFRAILAITFLFFSALTGLGQSSEEEVSIAPPMDWVHHKDWDRDVLQTDAHVDSGVRYLLLDLQKHSGKAERYVHHVEQMVNEQGVQDSGTLRFTFDPSYQKLILHRIQLHRAGQVINQLKRSALNVIQPEDGLDWDIYSGDHSATLFLEDLRVGDVLEYDYTIRGRNPILHNHFWSRFYLQHSVPIHEQFYRLILPKEIALRQRYHKSDRQPSIKDEGLWRDYRWEIPSKDALLIEDFIPYDFEPYAYMEFTDFASWAEVVQWALKLYPNAGSQITNEMQTMILSWQSEHQTQGERALAALQFVQDKVRYMAIEFGPNSHRPSSPSETFERRFGDCKDKAYLLCILLRAMGIKAWPAYVNTDGQKAIANCLPSPFAFNHVIVKMQIDDNEFWVDPTLNNQGGALKNRFLDAFGLALVVQPGQQNLEPIPLRQLNQPQVVVQDIFDITDYSNPVRFIVETIYYYGSADRMRATLLGTDRKQLISRCLNFYSRFYADIEQTKPLVILDDREANVLKVIEEYQIGDFWELSENRYQWTAMLYPYSLESLLTSPNTRLRQMPLRIPYPLHKMHRFIIHMPEQWNLDDESNSIMHDAFHLDFRQRVIDQTIHLEFELATHKGEVLPAQVAGYLKHLEEMENTLGYNFCRLNDDAGFAYKRINWILAATTPICAFLIAGGVIWIYTTPRFKPPSSPQSPVIFSELKLQGIGGWLIPVAIGICLSPLTMLFSVSGYFAYFDYAVWQDVALPEGKNYHQLFGPLIIFELLSIVAMLGFSILNLLMFFAKKALFPKVYIVFSLFWLAFVLIDHNMVVQIPQLAEESNAESVAAIGRSLIHCLIWCPYMILSKRVKDTFTN